MLDLLYFLLSMFVSKMWHMCDITHTSLTPIFSDHFLNVFLLNTKDISVTV